MSKLASLALTLFGILSMIVLFENMRKPSNSGGKPATFHLGGGDCNHCYAQNYSDPYYTSLGFMPDPCDPMIFTEPLDVHVHRVCFGDASRSLKYCPSTIVEVMTIKMGRGFTVAADCSTEERRSGVALALA